VKNFVDFENPGAIKICQNRINITVNTIMLIISLIRLLVTSRTIIAIRKIIHQ